MEEVVQHLHELLALIQEESLSSTHGSVTSIEDHLCDLMYQIGKSNAVFPSIVDMVKNVIDLKRR